MLPVLAALLAAGAAWWALRAPVSPGDMPPDAGAAPEAAAGGGDSLDARWALLPSDAAPGQVSGAVRAPDGGSVEGTRVTVARVLAGALRGPRRLPEVRAVGVGAGGAFDVGPLPPGQYAVTASGPSGTAGPQVVEVASGATARAELTLMPGTVVLSGRVRGAGGAALPGAVVTVEAVTLGAADAAVELHQVETGADGAYALQVRPGVYEVLVRASDHAPDRAARVVAGDLTHDVEPRPAARLGGRVHTATAGRRPEGARVRVVGGAAASETRADATGSFALDELEPGQVQLLVRWEDQVGLSAPVAVVAGERAEADVALSPGRVVTGLVKDTLGRPVTGAVVRLSATDPLLPLDDVARSDIRGAFRFEGLLEGTYRLEALGARGEHAASPMVVGRGAPSTAELRLEPGGTLVGSVTAAGGTPAAGARVRLDVVAGPDTGMPARLALADAQGRFRFEGVPAGQVVLAAAHEKLGAVRSASQPVGPGQQVSTGLTLPAPATVEGRVVGSDGKPVAGMPVAAMAEAHGVAPVVALSDAEGRYRLSPLGEGAQRVVLAPGGRWRPGLSALEREVTTTAGQTAGGVDLALPRAPGRMSGTVEDPEGRPLVGAAVVVLPSTEAARGPSPFETYQALSGAGGRFSLEAPPVARCTAWATHPRYVGTAGTELDCAAEKVVLKLGKGVAVTGEVRSPEGVLVPEYTLTVMSLGNTRPGAEGAGRVAPVAARSLRVRAAEGTFELGPFTPGRYVLRASTADGRAGQSLVELSTSGAPQRVRVQLHAAGQER
ncbi:carboxypeptidase-like regulatory domain-containing protein [Pyxidicoccus xibeiensis]|uniref:carboxypeptidase-like regulatory domain-containing protein n=1 Tax=Pyxidicoccus xibeiensis TaxID=2906759 RepID=UPI0020A701FB|nr:carboxypeptidase-like regulatory domain-containing protein [Pyxidicoccus xibeiensis]MCP3136344.1 carboxypeptidase-like regulatory domain-containing protein [Pyxidicoccus xibeiensis]